MSSRRSSYGRPASTVPSSQNAFVQSPTPLQYRVRLTTDASERGRPRRRGKWRRLTQCLRCGRSTSEAVIHTPPRRSSYSADDVESTLPACDRSVEGSSANDALQNPTSDIRLESHIPLIRVGSLDAGGNLSSNVASSSANFQSDETRHTVALRTHRVPPVLVESTAASSTSMTDSSTPPSVAAAESSRRTDHWQLSDTGDEQFTRGVSEDVPTTTKKRSSAVEALLLDRDQPDIVPDDSTQVRRASESPCTTENTSSSRRRQQQSKAASDALRQALEKRINDRLTDTARKAQKQRQEKKQDRKAAKTLSAILLAFIVTWTPYNVFTVVRTFVPSWIDPTVYAIGWFLYLLIM